VSLYAPAGTAGTKRFCKTTLWIKKFSLFFKDMTVTSLGPFSTVLGRARREFGVRHQDLERNRPRILTGGRRAASVA
jgi:hypothetical protein